MRSAPAGFCPPAPDPLSRPLGPFALLKALANNPIECWTKAHFEEPIVMGGFPFARVAVVTDPAAIRQILVENPSDYGKSALERRILCAHLRDGLVAVEGEQWRRQRQALAPWFSRKTVMHFAPEMALAAAALVERWQNHLDDDVVDIKAEMSRLSLDVLVRRIFSRGLGDDPNAFRTAMMSFFATAVRIDPFDLVGLPDFVPRITRLRLRPMLERFNRDFNTALSDRRRSLDGRSDGNPRDMLGAMLAAKDPETGTCMSEAEVRANVLTAIFAGQETTSTALTWAFYLLSQSPEWCARIREESERVLRSPFEEVPEQLVETRAVIDEAMRLYPPIVGITRTAGRDSEVAGRVIERGTMVVVSPYVLHRHRLWWDDPGVFDPARFLENASRPMERYAYLPFGVGPRMCIGAAFALQEASLVLATIIKHFSLALVPGQTVWPVQRFTLRPRDALLMAVSRR